MFKNLILQSRIFLLIEQIKVIFHFYLRSFRFMQIDFALGLSYFFSNPYRICRKHFQKEGEENVYAYGETPLTVWAKIVKEANITARDHLIDLGCGRGRLCFWTRFWVGCSVEGVDWAERFIFRANRLVRRFRMTGIQFQQAKMTRVNLRQATVVYLYTFHPDEEIIDFQYLPVNAQVITVSEPLVQSGFVTRKTIDASFPWGRTNIFINQKIT